MIHDTLYDFTVAVDYNGDQHVLDPPEGYAEWLFAKQGCPNCNYCSWEFDAIPNEPGIYRLITRFWEKPITSPGAMASGRKTYTGFTVLQYEPMRLVSSGCVVPVVNEREGE